MHIAGENTVNSNTFVQLVVFCLYHWWKHGKYWFSKQITSANTENSNAWVHLVIL